MAGITMAGDRSILQSDPEILDREALSDETLLHRFLNGEVVVAESAFRSLISRHGPMVLGVCKQVLGDDCDAEDAFQATFLVLARKAGSIRDFRVLGSWLYEVAYRVARRSRVRIARQKIREREAGQMAARVGREESDPAWNELRPVLHDEISRLPENYRVAVILCYLEGRTNEEAAKVLGWPVGTVKGRLSRARDLLRSRLTRRGLALSAAFLAACFHQKRVFAEVVPSILIDRTARSAMRLARGEGLAPIAPRVLSLANIKLRGYSDARIRETLFAAALVAVTVLGLVFHSRWMSDAPGLPYVPRVTQPVNLVPLPADENQPVHCSTSSLSL